MRDDRLEAGELLLEKVMAKGKIITPSPSLSRIQKIFLEEFSRLDEKYKSLEESENVYPVSLSPRLKDLQSKIIRKVKEKELGKS